MNPSTPTNDAQHVAARQKRVQMITFQLGPHHFAVPVEHIWRVEALADFQITRVPVAVEFLEGLINLHGQVIPVIHLKKRLGLSSVNPDQPSSSGYPPKARLLIVEMEIIHQNEEKVAMIVDTVNDIRWFPAANLRPPPPMVAEISSEYLHGVLEEESLLWIVLDLRRVLSHAERSEARNEVDKHQEDVLPEEEHT